jgi:hypothetical protein
MKIEVEIDTKLFNPIYFELQDSLSNDDIRTIIAYGGSSAAKTYSVVQAIVINLLSKHDENHLVFRKFGTDIKDSIYKDFKTVVTSFGLEEYFTFQQNFIRCDLTGNYVTFKGLDDSEKIKGLSGFKKIIMEEWNQFDYEDYKQIKKRLRGKKGQQIICLFNPVSELHWIKVEVFDKEVLLNVDTNIQEKLVNDNGDMVIYRTNYLDNNYINGKIFLDKHTIADFEKDKVNDYNYYRIYAEGFWGSLRTGNEFFKKFRTERHTRPLEYNEELPIWICLDENSLPYLACAIFQLDNNQLRQIDEIALESPRNTLRETCLEIIGRYDGHQGGMMITGDRTSLKADTKQEKGMNFFTLALQYLEQFRPQLKLNSVNPSVVMSKLFVDSILNNDYENIMIVIDSNNCKKAIYDYLNTKEDMEGKADKKIITNKITGARYQEFAHFSDTLRYITTLIYKSEYQIFLQGGRKIIGKIGKRAIK